MKYIVFLKNYLKNTNNRQKFKYFHNNKSKYTVVLKKHSTLKKTV